MTTVENIDKEIWKELPEYNHYAVSNFGRVKRLPHKIKTDGCIKSEYISKERILKQRKSKDGYWLVGLYSDNYKNIRYRYVHRLMAEVFIPKYADNLEVNHIDGNKENNCLSNLEWVTHQENIKHRDKMGLIKNKVTLGNHYKARKIIKYDLNGVFIKEYDSITEAALELGDKKKLGSISTCLSGRTHTAYGYIWKYKNEGEK